MHDRADLPGRDNIRHGGIALLASFATMLVTMFAGEFGGKIVMLPATNSLLLVITETVLRRCCRTIVTAWSGETAMMVGWLLTVIVPVEMASVDAFRICTARHTCWSQRPGS